MSDSIASLSVDLGTLRWLGSWEHSEKNMESVMLPRFVCKKFNCTENDVNLHVPRNVTMP